MYTTAIICLFILIAGRVTAQVEFCGEQVPLNQEYVKMKLLNTIKKNRGAVNPAIQQRAKLYLPFIAQTLQEYGLPADLQYIPFVESRLNNRAYSSAGASGMWQLMPATAQGEGLKVTLAGNQDDRNLVIKSTHAACRLLLKLYKQMGSWTLAVAAYNYGNGNIGRQISRQGTRDYYAMRLNRETAAYIYEIVSFKILYGLSSRGEVNSYYQAAAVSTGNVQQSPRMQQLAENSLVVTNAPRPAAAVRKKGWQANSRRQALVVTDTLPRQLQDTILVGASLIADSYVNQQQTGYLALTTTAPADINGFILQRNTLVKGMVFNKGKRMMVEAAGIEICRQLQEYNVLVYDLDGRQGLAIPANKRITIEDGYRVQLKFIRE